MINIATKPLNIREAKGEKPSLGNKQSFTEVTGIRVLGNIGWVSYCYQHRPVRGAKQSLCHKGFQAPPLSVTFPASSFCDHPVIPGCK
ncbi:hypothetical protein CEE34_10940 [Candidatus Aerophobetes bacterium Ae_b3a]|nr:MAG: hypothetical protein CEE34_10940 [Candidatus Aerophobetes bacterium Ae_b3a]